MNMHVVMGFARICEVLMVFHLNIPMLWSFGSLPLQRLSSKSFSMRIEWPGEEDFGGYIAYASFSKATSGPCTDRIARMEALEWGSCGTK